MPATPGTAEQEPLLTPMRLTADASAPGLGESVEVVVSAAGLEGVRGVAFHLLYDPRVLRYESAAEGPLLGGDGHPVVFLARPATAGDRLLVGLTRPGDDRGVGGSGVLARFRFAAVGKGEAGLAIVKAVASTEQGAHVSAASSVTPFELR